MDESEKKKSDLRKKLQLKNLSVSEIRHLSLSTEVGDGETPQQAVEEGNASQNVQSPESDVSGGAKKDVPHAKTSPAIERRTHRKLIPLLLWVLGGMVGLVVLLLLVALVMGRGGKTTGNGNAVVATPTIVDGRNSVSYLDFSVMDEDSDGDAIPNELEVLLGYDPNQNDCVRVAGCGDFPTLPRAKLRLNLIFILDASGSMADDIGDVQKWQGAVDALKKVLAQGFPGYTEVGLIVYGHKGSSSTSDRDVSCSGVEVMQSLDRWRNVDLVRRTSNLGPTGWTPLAGALRTAGDMLQDRQGEGNFVIVLSDGRETCGGDPVAVAKELKESGTEVTTNVVGLVVSDEEKAQLEAIAQAGGGGYFPANNPEELDRAVYLSSDAIRLWNQINQCIISNLTEYGSCLQVQYLKSINYVQEERLQVERERQRLAGGSGLPLPADYSKLEEKLRQKFSSLRNENWEQYREDLGNFVEN